MADTVSVTQADAFAVLRGFVDHIEVGTITVDAMALKQLLAIEARHRLASTQPAPAFPRETFESIIAWGDETFGPCSAERAVERGKEELVEADEEQPESTEHAVEIADTIICFLRVPGILDAINVKMAKNRARKWSLRGDGTGYHVKEPAPAFPREEVAAEESTSDRAS